MRTPHLSQIELSKKNLVHNIFQFRKVLKSGTKITAVVKGNAYGHGESEVVKIIGSYVDYFGVNSIQELETLRKQSTKKTFVLGYVEPTGFDKVFKMQGVPSIFSISHLKIAEKSASKLKKVQEINIALDAYLGREGVLPSELPKFLQELKKCKHLKLLGIYAHFANIEDTSNFTHANKQIKKYEEAVELVKKMGWKNVQTHISATSGIIAYEKGKGVHPIVRLGIGLYGMWPSEHLRKKYKNKITLKPVLTWKTKIAQVKTLLAGSTVGYGLTYKAKKEIKTAVIPQGYADGLDRRLSNKGSVLIKGTRCKILGRVMMNMCVVDVSPLKNVKAEDEVVILGRQGKQEITALEMADIIGTINYEITTRISPLLPRILL